MGSCRCSYVKIIRSTYGGKTPYYFCTRCGDVNVPMANIDILGILQEECAEVIQEVSKVRRTGPNFKRNGKDKTNQEELENEVLDVLATLAIAQAMGAVRSFSKQEIEERMAERKKRLAKWTPEALESNK